MPAPQPQPDGRPRRSGYYPYTAALGVASWAFLVAAVIGWVGPALPARPDPVAFGSFLFAVVAARALAYRVLPGSVLALDAAFYIAAAVCLGSVAAGGVVAIALTLDTVWRLLRDFRREVQRDGAGVREGESTSAEQLAYVAFFGGMTGALLVAVGWLFRFDDLRLLASAADVAVLLRMFVGGAVFVLCHYALQGVRNVLLGRPLRVYWRRFAAVGLTADLATLPLAAIIVFVYQPGQPLRFALLGATYLVICYAFNRLLSSTESLRLRVSELEILNATARGLASALQRSEVVRAMARETMEAIPEADMLSLTEFTSESGSGEVSMQTYDRATEKFEQLRGPLSGGVTAAVIDCKKPLLIRDLARSDHELQLREGEGVVSWLGVPLIVHGQATAVLAVQSRRRAAFGRHSRRLLEAIGSQTAVALQNAKHYELAMVDGLTRLHVRRYFDARIEEEVMRARRFETEFSLVMIDVDDFKKLNDSRGHLAGDRVLREVAVAIKDELRGVDTAARYGGEEFAVLLPRTSLTDAYATAERIRERIEALSLVDDGESLAVRASMGVAAFPDSGADSVDELVRMADQALYRAKRTGKNRVELFWGGDESPARLSVVPDAERADET